MNAHHLKMEIEILANRAHDTLREAGYSDDEIDRAASGLLSGTRITPSIDGKRPTPCWLWIETLSYARDGLATLDKGNMDAARAKMVESRERSHNALMLAGDDARRHKGGKNRKGALKPITIAIRALVETMEDKRPDAILAELAADAEGRENALYGLRKDGRTPIRATNADRHGFSYVDGNGRADSMAIGTLRNAASDARRELNL